MKKYMLLASMVVFISLSLVGHASAAPYLINDPFTMGTADWLADVRLRNFNTTIADYEMMVNASPTRTPGENQVNGHVPGSGAFADWAQNNAFRITYDPLADSGAGWVSLQLVGSGQRVSGSPGSYDVTIGRAPDAVTAGQVNYIEFSLWDRINFPTFTNGLTLSDLDGNYIGNFILSASGIDSWAIVDPDGTTLNDGFILQGDFTLDLSRVAEGREGDKIIFGIGNHSAVPIPGAIWLFGAGIVGLAGFRRRFQN
jgi:hypothetical protein